MAFGGSAGKGFGAAAALIEAGAIASPAGQYAAQVNAGAVAAGPNWQKTARTDARSRLNAIRYVGQAGADLLTGFVADPPAIANADTGQLVTAAAAANQHGLPGNFGPGRANWLAEHIPFFSIEFVNAATAKVAAGAIIQDTKVTAIAVAAGDLTITAHNRMDAVVLLAGSAMTIRFHSLL